MCFPRVEGANHADRAVDAFVGKVETAADKETDGAPPAAMAIPTPITRTSKAARSPWRCACSRNWEESFVTHERLAKELCAILGFDFLME
jgi:hypothetical protein